MADLRDDLPTAMTTAAFAGISWYIAIELNIRLLFAGTSRRHGLYFWSVLLCSWGVLTQPLVILLVNFSVWKPSPASVTVIYLSWWILVIPQSFVLYSRLHLFLEASKLRWLLCLLVFNTIVFSIPTIVIGVLGQTTMASTLGGPNRTWDKIQLAVFFAQEVLLSLLYIRETRIHIKRIAPLHEDAETSRRVLRNLIYINVLIICLDISLIGLCYSNLFYVQGHYKPCVYGIKLRMEFAILNQLRSTLQSSRRSQGYYRGSRSHHTRSTSESGVELSPGSTRVQNTSLDVVPSKGSRATETSIPHVALKPTWRG